MRISGVDFPEQMLSALRDDRLVVFAGAGVSMGDPANLPNFRQLAEIVARGTGQSLGKTEPVDRFLGGLARSGVEVHRLTANTLSAPDLRPTELHKQLLRCFRNDEAVRVVTTNFDLLFEQAADDEFSRSHEVFRAPALPLGTAFDGIVQLHGSVKRPNRMTLTDADFGRAYLAGRWAARFLVDLFQTYTVLFVGYSHDDIVMSYLARALADTDPHRTDAPTRFALTHEAIHERWVSLGISPIGYEKDADGEHTALVEGVTGLADYMQRGLLDWQRTIGDIARGLPPSDPEHEDLIDDALRDPSRLRFVTSAASGPAWIEWLEDRGHLAPLSDPSLTGHGDAIHRRLAWWLCHSFARDYADELFLLFGRHGLRMSSELWIALASQLGSKDQEAQEEREWESDVVAKWISLLLETIPESSRLVEHHLLHLAEQAARAGLDGPLVSVFDAMTRPLIPTRQAFVARQAFAAGPWTLGSVWRQHLAPRLGRVADGLLSVLDRRLRERHEMLCIWQGATRTFDLDTWHRTAVETDHDDSRYDDSIDVLIDAARDCSVSLAEREPLVAAGYINRMVRADAPMLRRIAVHGASHWADLSADQRIQWLLDHVGLYDRACKRELSVFMERTYPDASDDQRKVVLAAVDDHPDAQRESEGSDD